MKSTATIQTPYQSRPYRILVAEKEPEIRDHLQLALGRPNFVVDFAESVDTLLSAVASHLDAPSLIILDLTSRRDDIAILRKVRSQNSSLPIIFLSGMSSDTNCIEAIENGASSFLTKPISYEELRQAVDTLLPPQTDVLLRRPPGTSSDSDSNANVSAWARKTEQVLNRLAECDVPVLLQGETGVGKEVLARRIHNQSLRSGNIFLKLNCAALPSELVESELFGYEKGAFTGAFKNTPGKFELANGGTILLDEIGDMDLRLQAKLLQVLQDREFHRIGASEPTQVDVRVIAATHRDLESRIADGEFREDLYYRLNVVNIVIPPLRERTEEIIPLAASFLRKHASAAWPLPEIGPALRSALLRHQWPGNIRELENLMRRYLVVRNQEMIIEELHAIATRGARREWSSMQNLARPDQSRWGVERAAAGDVLGRPAVLHSREFTKHRQPANEECSSDDLNGDSSELMKLDQARQVAEIEVIKRALYSTQWNRKRAAVLLGVDYKALLYKMKKLGIE